MRGKKKLLAALPTLTDRELWMLKIDIHRAADAVAIGGGSDRQWNEYLDVEDEIKSVLSTRDGGKECPFDNGYIHKWTPDEYKELSDLLKRIMKGKKK